MELLAVPSVGSGHFVTVWMSLESIPSPSDWLAP
jgi:hypothetical protein